MNNIDINKYQEQAKSKYKESKKFLSKLKNKKPKDLDKIVKDLHDEYSSKIDCLLCANCCKSLGPGITQKDIDRISKHLGLSQDKFIDKYLRIDEDNDYVFKEMPCPFLMSDNYCLIYDYRPKACAEYPHTDRRKFHQILNITLKNTITCPIVFEIVEDLKKYYK